MPTPKKRSTKAAGARRTVKRPVERPAAPPTPPAERKAHYEHTVGRRKSATAFLRYYPQHGEGFTVNDQPVERYFPSFLLQYSVTQLITVTGWKPNGRIEVSVHGGGKRGQADSVRLALSRLLVKLDAGYHPTLRKLGFLTRDARVKERKKYGLKRARRAPQWQKR